METYISSKSFDETRQLLDRKLGWDHRKTHLAPNNATINRWVSEFRGDRLPFTGNRAAADLTRYAQRRLDFRQVEQQSVLDSPERSVMHRAQRLRLKWTSLNAILRKDLRLHPYRIQVRQKLTPEERSRRVKMAQWFAELSSTVSGSLTKCTSGSAGT